MEKTIIDIIFYGTPAIVVIAYLYFDYKEKFSIRKLISELQQKPRAITLIRTNYVGSIINLLDQELKIYAGIQTITLVGNEGFRFSVMPRDIPKFRSLLDDALNAAAEVEATATEWAMQAHGPHN